MKFRKVLTGVVALATFAGVAALMSPTAEAGWHRGRRSCGCCYYYYYQPQQVAPAPAPPATAQQPGDRRAMSIEPAPVQQFYSAPVQRSMPSRGGAPYLRADSKAKGY